MTQTRLNMMLNEVKQDFERMGVAFGNVDSNVRINNRIKKSFGRCRRHNATNTFTIEITQLGLSCPEEKIYGTLAHELLHTVSGCFNHGTEFKRMASYINANGSHDYQIKRLTSHKESGTSMSIEQIEEPYRHKIICEGCGHEYKFKRMNKTIKLIRMFEDMGHESGYRCSKCKSTSLFYEPIR